MPTSRSNKPSLVITMGDPSGVGPEVALKALASPRVKGLADFLVIGDSGVIERAKKDLGLSFKAPLLDLSNVHARSFSYGKMCPDFGRASIQYVDTALRLLKEGRAAALVTGPVNKSSVMASGVRDFEGHTEYLAKNTGTKYFAMIFVGKRLKVALVTRHIALGKVSGSLSIGSVYNTIMLAHEYLKNYFHIRSPKIGVAGLNPHAGEGGAFGSEEADIITPAIRKASRKVRGVSGPVPPDVVFYAALNEKYDCVISMYHDQALAPFKMLYFYSGVNLTIGLPFIRTSPDHGTAFNIAGKGIADPTSMIEALILAAKLASRK